MSRLNRWALGRRRQPSGGCRTVRWTDWPPTAFWWCTRATASTRTPNRVCGGKSQSAATSSRCGKPDHLSRGAGWWVTHYIIIIIIISTSCSFTERKPIGHCLKRPCGVGTAVSALATWLLLAYCCLDKIIVAAVRLLTLASSACSANCCSSVLLKNFISLGKLSLNMASSFVLVVFSNPLWKHFILVTTVRLWRELKLLRYLIQRKS